MTEQKSMDSRWRGIETPLHCGRRRAVCAAPCTSNIRWRGSAPRSFWGLLQREPVVGALGCMTGNQAVQSVQAGLKAIYCSGWQVAGDGNSAGEMYPDQSLYPVDSVPKNGRTHQQRPAAHRPDSPHERQIGHRLAGAYHCRCRSGFRGQPQCIRTDQVGDPRRRGRGCISRISFHPRRNAAIWAARFWCPPARRSTSW